MFTAELDQRAVYVLGNETDGLALEVAEQLDQRLAIPLAGGVESLNVAAAAAVLCFEVVRRTQSPSARAGRSGQ